MRRSSVRCRFMLPGMVFLVLLQPGCTDEEAVFDDRPLFLDSPDPASSFLGYFEPAEKRTTCGNCHAAEQSVWKTTGHANAWADLQASPAAEQSCEGCHAVSDLGNALQDPGGQRAVQDERFHDVQCESCHGAGLNHIRDPSAVQPVASLRVAENRTCGECHSAMHQPFVQEWEESPHALVVSSAAGQEECAGCHSGQGALERFDASADYLEKDSDEPLAMVCAVCHDPHEAYNEHQLRFPVNTTSVELHLCAQCHHRRSVPDPTSSHGLAPHSPEAGLLAGEAGWFPPGVELDRARIRTTHGSDRNPKLCAACHLAPYTVTDPATGNHVFSASGHLFRPIPCIDDTGIPLGLEFQCGLSNDERSYGACTGSGCHEAEGTAFAILASASERIRGRAEDLLALLRLVDPNLAAAGGAIDASNPTFTVAEGAFFNYNLAFFGSAKFGTNTTVGSTAHNPFLMDGLLIASIQAVMREYGVSTPSAAATDWDASLREVLRREAQ